ncbi:MAG: ATP-binding protein [Oscillatoria sp. PMC 1051.18]|nr:ATP-binding protein [Oscillatoria sp. PMC 1050.18]MEC5033029.1 ATP-binding protein [Oscillatoria sp. PMC 1051.18]
MPNINQLLRAPGLERAMERNFLCVSVETSVAEAIALRNSLNTSPYLVTTLVVVEQKQVLGLLSERELLALLVSGKSLSTKVAEVMNSSLITLKLSDSPDILTALSLLNRYQLNCLPVVDDRQEIEGIITHQSINQAILACNSDRRPGFSPPPNPPSTESQERQKPRKSLPEAITTSDRHSPNIYNKLFGAISARLKATEELTHTQEQLQAFFNAVPGFVSWVGSDGRYLKVNQHFASTYNLTPEDFLGKKVGLIESSPELTHIMDQFLASSTSKITCEVTSKVKGEFHNYLVVAQKYQNGNAAVTVGIDITERKRTEEQLLTATCRLSALIENLQAGVVVLDEFERVVLINQTFCNLFAIPILPAALIGADFTDFAEKYQHCFAQPKQFKQRYQAILSARKIVTAEELQLANAKVLERDYVPIAVEENYVGNLWMYRDITQRKQSEAELRNSLVKQQELAALRSRFVTMTSHEFRTPLSTILSSAELLEHYRYKWTEEKQLLHLHRIQNSVKQMRELLDDILIIGKAEAGKLEFNPVAIDLVSFCRELVEDLQLNAFNKQEIAFTYQGEKTQIFLDEKLLRQILTNLLSNAIKYSFNGSTVKFSVLQKQQEVIFQVQDRGIGIPSEDRLHLFEPFHRGSNVDDLPGTGLGLSIVKKCVDFCQGTIKIKSQVGQGTEFTVILPIGH